VDLRAYDVSLGQDLTDAGAIIELGAGTMIDLRLLGGEGVIYVEYMGINAWGNSDLIFA
jgi:hypothetical protein